MICEVDLVVDRGGLDVQRGLIVAVAGVDVRPTQVVVLTTGDVDLSYLLRYGGVFEPVRDLDFFRRLQADPEAGTIVWPNGADVAPETLYAHAQGRTTTMA